MNEKYPKSLLASYTTFKELYGSQKYSNPYQILSEFVIDIILTQHISSFEIEELRIRLKQAYGFDLPTLVIGKAIKAIDFIRKEEGRYYPDYSKAKNAGYFEKYKEQAEINISVIEDALLKFVEESYPNNKYDPEKIIQELVLFCLNESGVQEYHELIGKFVISCDSNPKMKQELNAVLEGGILYAGLTYNISEFGSITDELSLYLDTEILFDIVGYNGSLFKSLADDFLRIVESANLGKRNIRLVYFSDVKNEIESFFDHAERLIEGKEFDLLPKQAMCSILDGCENSSDVAEKKADFYQELQCKYRVFLDKKESYYTRIDDSFNLEGVKVPVNNSTTEEDSNTILEGIKYCSHINKLRKGVIHKDYLKCQYLFVTRTTKVIEVSKYLVESSIPEKENICEYAVHLSFITNLLWNKLNRGFGSTKFPLNLDSICRARQVLSSYISQGMYKKYCEIEEKYRSGELTEDSITNYIIIMRQKKTLPEEIDIETVDDSLAFDESYFESKFEEIAYNERELKERDRTIEELKSNIEKMNNSKKEQDDLLVEQKQRIDELEKTLNGFVQKENERIKEEEEKRQAKENKKRLYKNIFKHVLLWFFRLVFPIFLAVLVKCVCNKFDFDYGTWLGVAIGVLGYFFAIWTGIKSEIKQLKSDNGK